LEKLVSVIIPTYNNAQYLVETLESIFLQNYNRMEIIIADDGSTDHTQAVLEKYQDQIVYFYQDNSGGCSKPRNEAIKRASGEYIAIFDADDIMKPGKISAQSDFLNANSSVDFVFTDFCEFSEKGTDINHLSKCLRFQKIERLPACKEGFILPRINSYGLLFQENYISPSSVMFRSELVKKIGMYDEALKSSEDIDFHFRVTAQNDIGYLDNVYHLRRVHAGSMSSKTEKVLNYKIITRKKQLPIKKRLQDQISLRKSLHNFYFSLSYFFRKEGRFSSAWESNWKGIFYWPFDWRLYFHVLKIVFQVPIKDTEKNTSRLSPD
jgi:glycosyltransferase involved in cell wall biosynthesis